MSQYVLFVCCWLLAVGRGSGLTGLTTRDHKTTRGSAHSPGPPTTPLTIPTANHSLANVTLTFYPLHVNTTPGVTGYEGALISRGFTASTTPLPSSTSAPTTSSPTFLPVSSSTKSPPPSTSEPKNTINTSQTTSTTVKPTTSFPKERVQDVVQSLQKELFIRRKHKGPYYANRVKKLSATLRASDPPEVDDHTDNPERVNLSSTLNSAAKAFKSINKNRAYKTTRPHHNLNTSSVEKPNTTKQAPRKRPITMGIPASSSVLQVHRVTSSPPPHVQPYSPPDSDEYYSSYAEYPDGPNFGYNMSKYSEAAVLPDPDIAPGLMEAETEVEAEVVLPDDSLADTDLHDHDLIDSVMYIYFGSSERDERGAGRQVLIVGAVISLVAQFLTLASVLRRLRSKPDESASLVLLNAELALTVGNLVFMLGVQATGSQRRCELVAVTLHYLHLVACCWFLVNSIHSYGSLHPLQTEKRRRLRPYWLAAWCLPAVVVLLCVGFNRRGYETRSFCWVSVARGMLYSFMVPVAALIVLNTWFAVLGLRQLSLSKAEDNAEDNRKSMRVSAILLPVFAVVWFLGVVALENSASLVFPLLFVASSGFLNWFVLACWLPADLSLWRDSDEDYDEDDDDLYEEVLKTQTDSQPLLEEPPIYVCGRRDLCELQMDPICTISS